MSVENAIGCARNASIIASICCSKLGPVSAVMGCFSRSVIDDSHLGRCIGISFENRKMWNEMANAAVCFTIFNFFDEVQLNLVSYLTVIFYNEACFLLLKVFRSSL